MIIHTFSFSSSILRPPICPLPCLPLQGISTPGGFLRSFLLPPIRGLSTAVRTQSLHSSEPLLETPPLLVKSFIPFSIQPHHIHQFSSSIIADLEFIRKPVSRLVFARILESRPALFLRLPLDRGTHSKTLERTEHASLLIIGQPAADNFVAVSEQRHQELNFRHQKDRYALPLSRPGITSCFSPTLRARGRYLWEGGIVKWTSYDRLLEILANFSTDFQNAIDSISGAGIAGHG